MLFRSIPLRNLGRKASVAASANTSRSLSTSTSGRYNKLSSPLRAHTSTTSQHYRTSLSHRVLTRAYSAPMAAPTDTAAAEVANTTGITPDTLSETLKQKLDASHVDIQDISGGCGASFSALIVSAQFQGKTTLARHRLVNNALKAEIAAIHAWTPRCLTPEQWDKLNQEQGQA